MRENNGNGSEEPVVPKPMMHLAQFLVHGPT